MTTISLPHAVRGRGIIIIIMNTEKLIMMRYTDASSSVTMVTVVTMVTGTPLFLCHLYHCKKMSCEGVCPLLKLPIITKQQ